jgi:hypothetical protein
MRVLNEIRLLPDEAAIQKIIEVVGDTPEALQYFFDRYKEIIDQKHAGEKLSSKLDEYYTLARCKFDSLPSSDAFWNGESPTVSSQDFLENVSIEALKDLNPEIAKDIELHVAIEEDYGHILRGYSSQGEALSGSDLDAMDKSFNAWLLSVDVKSQDSVLYACDEEGYIQYDKFGKPIVADTDKIHILLQDKEQGFAAYMGKKGAKVQIFEHAYPAQTAKASPAAKSKEMAQELKEERLNEPTTAQPAKDTGPAEPSL